jgi:hypothetical protein
MAHLTLTPAYGRDYKSAKAVEVDLLKDKDFTVQPQGCYVNLAQLEPGQTLNVRYQRMTKVAVFSTTKLKSKPPPAPNEGDFDVWLKNVGRQVTAISGLTISDFADAPTRDWFNDGCTATKAARSIVRNDW